MTLRTSVTLLAGNPLSRACSLDRGLVLGEVDAEGLVVDHVGLLPLRLAGELRERLVRLRRGIPELGPVERADAGDLAFDDVPFHGRVSV